MADCSDVGAARRRAGSSIFPGRSGDLLPSRFVDKLEALYTGREQGLGQVAKVTAALPDLAGLALPPSFAGDICAIMGDGAQRSSAGAAIGIGILVAPILAVSRMARVLGIDLTHQSLGIQEPDYYVSPASSAARLDSLEFRLVESRQNSDVDSLPSVLGCTTDVPAEDSLLREPENDRQAADAGGTLAQRTTEEESDMDDSNVDEITCSICQCDFEKGEYAVVIRKCRHSFHVECLRPWLDRRQTCPMCRKPVEAARVKAS